MDYAYYNNQAQAAFHGQQFNDYTSAGLQYAPVSEAQEGQVRQGKKCSLYASKSLQFSSPSIKTAITTSNLILPIKSKVMAHTSPRKPSSNLRHHAMPRTHLPRQKPTAVIRMESTRVKPKSRTKYAAVTKKRSL